MNITKRKIADLPMVYSTAELFLNGKRYLAAASEADNGHAYIIDPVTLAYSDLCLGDTGVMNIIQIPGKEKLLAITGFYPGFNSKGAKVCLIEPAGNETMSPWKMRPVLDLPFCHRIGIIQNKNGFFLLGCQLCHDKEYPEDWSQTGSLRMAKIPENTDEKWKWYELYKGLTKNHGLYIKGGDAFICSENGVMKFDLSGYELGQYVMPTLICTTPTSDLWITDSAEGQIAVTIEPFHGNLLGVYKYNERFEQTAQYPLDFGHVAWAGEILGRTFAIAGSRGGEKELALIDIATNEKKLIEKDVGPTQITVYREDNTVYILSANHGANEIAVYAINA